MKVAVGTHREEFTGKNSNYQHLAENVIYKIGSLDVKTSTICMIITLDNYSSSTFEEIQCRAWN